MKYLRRSAENATEQILSLIAKREVKAIFDSSALVPVFYGDHVHHKASLARFVQCDKKTGCCGAHSLVEVYSPLTRMHGKHRISGEQAMLFVGDICERLSLISLDGQEYLDALQMSAERGIAGGAIHDALLAQCAVKVRAEITIPGIYAITRDAALRC